MVSGDAALREKQSRASLGRSSPRGRRELPPRRPVRRLATLRSADEVGAISASLRLKPSRNQRTRPDERRADARSTSWPRCRRAEVSWAQIMSLHAARAPSSSALRWRCSRAGRRNAYLYDVWVLRMRFDAMPPVAPAPVHGDGRCRLGLVRQPALPGDALPLPGIWAKDNDSGSRNGAIASHAGLSVVLRCHARDGKRGLLRRPGATTASSSLCVP
jgi:hypothetical protein